MIRLIVEIFFFMIEMFVLDVEENMWLGCCVISYMWVLLEGVGFGSLKGGDE